ncbi:MAG: hypothetical protein ACYC3G_03440, partial [Minisyncoccota bacterium]
MNKIIKLSTILFLGVAFCFTTAQAATFNTDPQDYPTIQVANYTKYPSCTTCWSSSVTASAGDVITFKIYYHNTGTDNATQTRFRLNLPTGTFNSQSITGQVWAQNAVASMGAVQVNLTSSQSLSLVPGNTYWYKYTTLTALPFNQTGNEVITTEGLNLGDIAFGSENAGYVLVRVMVSGTSTGSGTTSSSSISTNSASSISLNNAILNGTVDSINQVADVWFEYGTSNDALTNLTQVQRVGLTFTAQNFDYVLTNLSPNTTYYFRAVRKNISSGVETRGEILSFNTNNVSSNSSSNYYSSGAPEVTTNYVVADSIDYNSATLDAFIKPNGSNTVAWFTYWSCETQDIYDQKTEKWRVSVTDYQADFQQKITGLMPDTCYYFRAEAENENGTASGNDRVFRTRSSSIASSITFSQPTVLTSQAMFVRENSALINGSVVPNNADTSVWFEWSENPEMTIGLNKSIGQNAGSGTSEVYTAHSLSGLTLNKTYYFRVVAQNSYGTTKGNINKFTTVKVAEVIPVPAASTNTPSIQAPIKYLTLEGEFDNTNPRAGSKVIYGINYKNNSKSTLKDAVLKITLPNEVNYMTSSFANVKQDGTVLTFKLGDIAPGSSGTVSTKLKITDLARAQNLKFSIELSYSIDGKDGKETLVNNLQISEYSLAASVLETLGSIFNNIYVYFILGLLIGAGTYHYYAIRKKEEKESEDPLK